MRVLFNHHSLATIFFSFILGCGANAGEEQAQKVFVTEMAKEFAPAFSKGIESYNKNRKNLPPITVNQKGEAQIDFTEIKLRFSVDTFLQGYILLNEERLNLKNVTLHDIEVLLSKKNKTSFLMNLIISSAYAKR